MNTLDSIIDKLLEKINSRCTVERDIDHVITRLKEECNKSILDVAVDISPAMNKLKVVDLESVTSKVPDNYKVCFWLLGNCELFYFQSTKDKNELLIYLGSFGDSIDVHKLEFDVTSTVPEDHFIRFIDGDTYLKLVNYTFGENTLNLFFDYE